MVLEDPSLTHRDCRELKSSGVSDGQRSAPTCVIRAQPGYLQGLALRTRLFLPAQSHDRPQTNREGVVCVVIPYAPPRTTLSSRRGYLLQQSWALLGFLRCHGSSLCFDAAHVRCRFPQPFWKPSPVPFEGSKFRRFSGVIMPAPVTMSSLQIALVEGIIGIKYEFRREIVQLHTVTRAMTFLLPLGMCCSIVRVSVLSFEASSRGGLKSTQVKISGVQFSDC